MKVEVRHRILVPVCGLGMSFDALLYALIPEKPLVIIHVPHRDANCRFLICSLPNKQRSPTPTKVYETLKLDLMFDSEGSDEHFAKTAFWIPIEGRWKHLGMMRN